MLPPFLLFGRNPEALLILLPSGNRKNLLKTLRLPKTRFALGRLILKLSVSYTIKRHPKPEPLFWGGPYHLKFRTTPFTGLNRK